MFFCDKCGYLFNITKDIKSKQVGGKINIALNSLFPKLRKNEQISEEDLHGITGKNITEDERYDTMNKREQRRVISTIKGINPSFFTEDKNTEEHKTQSQYAYFICRFCKNYKKIEPGTVIYSKTYYADDLEEIEDYSLAVYDNTLARTRGYVCHNRECETHKNPDIREAILTKNLQGKIVYVCAHCKISWTGGS